MCPHTIIPRPVMRLSTERDVAFEMGVVTEYTAVEGKTTMSVYLGELDLPGHADGWI